MSALSIVSGTVEHLLAASRWDAPQVLSRVGNRAPRGAKILLIYLIRLVTFFRHFDPRRQSTYQGYRLGSPAQILKCRRWNGYQLGGKNRSPWLPGETGLDECGVGPPADSDEPPVENIKYKGRRYDTV
jgi:hypothetical protein